MPMKCVCFWDDLTRQEREFAADVSLSVVLDIKQKRLQEYFGIKAMRYEQVNSF